ncbi:hypothetical protein HYY71_03015 [Candidatus Woesearchaeota archaeon]|nr:hypothetical protein [Candidatus Woesearchaeota archaeon]
MSKLVYLIEDVDAKRFGTDPYGKIHIPFSRIGQFLQHLGFQLGDLTIDHVLVDVKVPIRDFEDYFYPKDNPDAKLFKNPKPWTVRDTEDYYDAISISNSDWFRYQTIVRQGDTVHGGTEGYSHLVRDRRLHGMLRVYVKDDGDYKSPFFVITNPESSVEVIGAFNTLGCNVEKIPDSKLQARLQRPTQESSPNAIKF